MSNLPPRRPTVSFSAPVGATIEFGAADAPRTRPRVRAIRDMAGMMATGIENHTDKLRLNNQQLPELHGRIYIQPGISGSPYLVGRMSSRPPATALAKPSPSRGAVLSCFRKIRLRVHVNEDSQSLCHLLEKLSSAAGTNERSCRALVSRELRLLSPESCPVEVCARTMQSPRCPAVSTGP